MNRIRHRILGLLFPEYIQLCSFMADIKKAEVQLVGKTVTFEKPTIFIGRLYGCTVIYTGGKEAK